jgi:antitoxin MazE
MKHTLAISSWGNSHGVRLSRSLMESAGIAPGAELEAVVVGPGRLELRAKAARPSLAQKLKRFDAAVHGGELMAGVPAGVEFGARKP